MTYLPILLTLGLLRPIRRVLELGCGECSTIAFLDRECFPDLVELISYENDAMWGRKVGEMVGDDPRINLRLINGAIAKAATEEWQDNFDLVLIDDSVSIEERRATISSIVLMHPRRALVVMHDFEVLPYRQAARGFRHRFRFTGLNPNTGLAWNEDGLSRAPFRRLNRALHERMTDSILLQDRSPCLRWLEQYFMR